MIDELMVIELDGMLTLGSQESLEHAVDEALEQGTQLLVLDLFKVKYVDSIGIGVLAEAFQKVNSAGGELSLARANEKVKTLLKLTGLEQVIQVFSTIEEAALHK
jgi:anti-anti-sigma factor